MVRHAETRRIARTVGKFQELVNDPRLVVGRTKLLQDRHHHLSIFRDVLHLVNYLHLLPLLSIGTLKLNG